MRAWAPGLVGIAVAGSACVEPALVTCSDGTVCPAELACAPTGGGCVDPALLAACDGLPDGAGCDLAGLGTGTCRDGRCTLEACGNGQLDPAEACDDGNTVSGDGCTASCMKIERCGDGELDEGEACDDGNTSAVDRCDACGVTTWSVAPLLAGEGLAAEASVSNPWDVAVDARGDVYVSSAVGVHRVDLASGVWITLLEGVGAGGIAVDGLGDVYLARASGVLKIDGQTHAVTTLTTLSSLDVAVDGLGVVYVARAGELSRLEPDGTATRIAGTGAAGDSGDGGDALAAQVQPFRIAFGPGGDLYFSTLLSHRVRKVDLAAGLVSAVAGGGAGGDGGPALAAQLYHPHALGVAANGDVILGERRGTVRRVDAVTGLITTIAGASGYGFGGDGGPGLDAKLSQLRGLAVAPNGDVAIADTLNHRIRYLDAATQSIRTLVGTGVPVGRTRPLASSVRLGLPRALALAPNGDLIVLEWAVSGAEPERIQVKRVERATGVVTTVAGLTRGFAGDDGPASAAMLSALSMAVDAGGNIYLAEYNAHRIRKIDAATQIITTIAGTGTRGTLGEGGPATDAQLDTPRTVAVDLDGNVYIGDAGRLTRIDAATGVLEAFDLRRARPLADRPRSAGRRRGPRAAQLRSGHCGAHDHRRRHHHRRRRHLRVRTRRERGGDQPDRPERGARCGRRRQRVPGQLHRHPPRGRDDQRAVDAGLAALWWHGRRWGSPPRPRCMAFPPTS
ncbi:MAG: hypothetical protein R2939_10520 [Kofleriaceae bacterium]